MTQNPKNPTPTQSSHSSNALHCDAGALSPSGTEQTALPESKRLQSDAGAFPVSAPSLAGPITFTCSPGASREVRKLAEAFNQFARISARVDALNAKLAAQAQPTSEGVFRRLQRAARVGTARALIDLYGKAQAKIVDALIPVLNGPDAAACAWIAPILAAELPPQLVNRLRESCPRITFNLPTT